MEPLANPTGEPVTRKAKMGKGMPDDYVLYLTACNEKVLAPGDIRSAVLPEHIWRASLLKK
jgi:hypothetical protein